MRKKTIRLLALLALCMAVVFSSSVTAFAYAEDTEQDLPVTEATQPEETPKPDPEPEEVPETITRVNRLTIPVMPIPAICCMTRPPTSSLSLSRPKAAAPSMW